MVTPNIPNELYREIAWHLHRPEHRLSLLALALVSTAWRHESQRLLFRIIDTNWIRCEGILQKIQAHRHFLEIVLEHPTRLGSYVHSYEQKFVTAEPRLRMSHPLCTQE